ncbi:MAG: phage holin family protein [Acidobacteriota bacterium]
MQPKQETIKSLQANTREESLTTLLRELASNSAALVRDELALAKQEMSEKIASLNSGIMVTAIGSILALLSLMVLSAAAVIVLAPYAGLWQSALMIGLGLAIVGGSIALTGIQKIKAIKLKPEKTVKTLEEDKQWLKEIS